MPEARQQVSSLSSDLPGERPVLYRAGGIGADGPEDRGVGVRCILGFNSGPPIMPSGYNNNMQLFQTPDHVVILTEMVHDARIIPLDGRAHLSGELQQWNGDSRGRWDGDTLVVETTNFTGKTAGYNDTITTASGSGLTLHLTERFTRVDADTLLYEYNRRRPEDLHTSVHRRAADAEEHWADLRVRVSRGGTTPWRASWLERAPKRGEAENAATPE